MKLRIALLLFAASVNSFGAIAAVSHASAQANLLIPAVTSIIDTTGATLLVAIVGFNASGQANDPGPFTNACSAVTVSDSKSNTWVAYTNSNFNFDTNNICIWYVESPTVGTLHTFTVTPAGIYQYPIIFASSWSGTATSNQLDQYIGASNGVTAIPVGPITPLCDNELIITSEGGNNSTSRSINGGFTFVEEINTGETGGWAYLIQTTATAAYPTWQAAANNNHHVAAIASFRAATGCSSDPARLITNTQISSSAQLAAVTSGVNTTGADLLLLQAEFTETTSSTNLFLNACSLMTVTDSKSNTWTATTNYQYKGNDLCVWYAVNPAVGTNHTFTVTPPGSTYGSAAVFAMAWTGMDTVTPYDKINGAGNGSGTIQAGSITPACSNEVVIASISDNLTTPRTIDSSFIVQGQLDQTLNPASGSTGAWAYKVQTSAAAVNPTWTAAPNVDHHVAVITSFKSATSSCGGGVRHRVVQQ